MPCQHCTREISNAGSLKAHEMSCKMNPNKISHKHSELAGQQKGSAAWNKGKKTGRMEYWDKKFPDDVIFSAASEAQINLSLFEIEMPVTSLDPLGSFFILNKEAFSADQTYTNGSYPF